jgi:hypothetical protein
MTRRCACTRLALLLASQQPERQERHDMLESSDRVQEARVKIAGADKSRVSLNLPGRE